MVSATGSAAFAAEVEVAATVEVAAGSDAAGGVVVAALLPFPCDTILFIAATVLGPTMPYPAASLAVLTTPSRSWNRFTAASVAAPKYPVALPPSYMPGMARKLSCSALTSWPDIPFNNRRLKVSSARACGASAKRSSSRVKMVKNFFILNICLPVERGAGRGADKADRFDAVGFLQVPSPLRGKRAEVAGNRSGIEPERRELSLQGGNLGVF